MKVSSSVSSQSDLEHTAIFRNTVRLEKHIVQIDLQARHQAFLVIPWDHMSHMRMELLFSKNNKVHTDTDTDTSRWRQSMKLDAVAAPAVDDVMWSWSGCSLLDFQT